MTRTYRLLFHVCVSFLLAPIAASAAPIKIDTVVVGNVGNAADSTGFGRVDHEYHIGKFEVTIGQYVAFLNAVAATDKYNLYKDQMTTVLNSAGIMRSGSPGSYTYEAIGSPNRPVTYVNWYDTLRFSNWLHHGQPTGSAD